MEFKKLFCVLLLLFTTGCSTAKSEEAEETVTSTIATTDSLDYGLIYTESVTTRNYTARSVDAIAIEKGMLKESKNYFSVKNYLLSGNTMLDNDCLVSLLASQSENNPDGLNMNHDDSFSQDVPALRNIVSNLVEMDFYDSNDSTKLSAVTMAMLLRSDVQDYSLNEYTIDEEAMLAYGQSVTERLLDKIHEVTNEDTDVLVLYYYLGSEDVSLPGTFLGKTLYKDGKTTYESISDHYEIFPSSVSKQYDEATYHLFELLKETIQDYTNEFVTTIGTAHYYNEQLSELSIQVATNSASYQYNSALSKLITNVVNDFDTSKMNLIVEIQYYGDTIFTISKKTGELKCTILDMN